MPMPLQRLLLSPRRAAAALLVLALAGCGGGAPRRVSYDPEEFDSTTTHARSYAATEAQTCEAARRALLSQGYLIVAANADLVTGRKSFQPAAEVHVEVEFRVVCARENAPKAAARKTTAFVTALQDRYGMKKVNNAASVGVGVIGSLSLPFSSSDDAMVKVASETLTDERFYDRFFALIDRYLTPGAVDEKAEEPVLPAPASGASPAVTMPVAPQVVPAPAPLGTPLPPSPDRG
jgi:hypothetical protein